MDDLQTLNEYNQYLTEEERKDMQIARAAIELSIFLYGLNQRDRLLFNLYLGGYHIYLDGLEELSMTA